MAKEVKRLGSGTLVSFILDSLLRFENQELNNLVRDAIPFYLFSV